MSTAVKALIGLSAGVYLLASASKRSSSKVQQAVNSLQPGSPLFTTQDGLNVIVLNASPVTEQSSAPEAGFVDSNGAMFARVGEGVLLTEGDVFTFIPSEGTPSPNLMGSSCRGSLVHHASTAPHVMERSRASELLRFHPMDGTHKTGYGCNACSLYRRVR